MEQAKIIIKMNEREANRLKMLSELWGAKLNDTEFKSEFSKLKIGSLTDEILNDCFIGNCRLIEKLVKDQVTKDVSKFSNEAIRKEMLKYSDIQISNFRKFCKDFVGIRIEEIISVIDYLEVKDDQIRVSPTANEKITNACRYEISDPKEIEIYKEIKAISDHYNKLLGIVGEKTKFSIHLEKMSYFLEFDNFGTYESKPNDDLNYWQLLNV